MNKYGNVLLLQLQLLYVTQVIEWDLTAARRAHESVAGAQPTGTTGTSNVLISLKQLSTKFFFVFFNF